VFTKGPSSSEPVMAHNGLARPCRLANTCPNFFFKGEASGVFPKETQKLSQSVVWTASKVPKTWTCFPDWRTVLRRAQRSPRRTKVWRTGIFCLLVLSYARYSTANSSSWTLVMIPEVLDLVGGGLLGVHTWKGVESCHACFSNCRAESLKGEYVSFYRVIQEALCNPQISFESEPLGGLEGEGAEPTPTFFNRENLSDSEYNEHVGKVKCGLRLGR